jgi:hypothetical protein
MDPAINVFQMLRKDIFSARNLKIIISVTFGE